MPLCQGYWQCHLIKNNLPDGRVAFQTWPAKRRWSHSALGTGLVHGGGMHQKPWYNHGQCHEFPGPPAFGQPGIERLELQGGKLPVAAHHLLYRRSPWCIRIQFPNGIHVLRHLEFSLLRCSYFCQRGSRFSTSAGQLRISVLLDRSSCNANFRIPGVPGVLARMTRSHSLAAASAGKTFTN